MKRPLTVEDIEMRLATDEGGKLYRDGREVRTGGFTRPELLTIAGLVIAAIAATASILKFIVE